MRIAELAKSIGYAMDLMSESKSNHKNKYINCAMCGKRTRKYKGNQKYCPICKSEAVMINLRKMGQKNF